MGLADLQIPDDDEPAAKPKPSGLASLQIPDDEPRAQPTRWSQPAGAAPPEEVSRGPEDAGEVADFPRHGDVDSKVDESPPGLGSDVVAGVARQAGRFADNAASAAKSPVRISQAVGEYMDSGDTSHLPQAAAEAGGLALAASGPVGQAALAGGAVANGLYRAAYPDPGTPRADGLTDAALGATALAASPLARSAATYAKGAVTSAPGASWLRSMHSSGMDALAASRDVVPLTSAGGEMGLLRDSDALARPPVNRTIPAPGPGSRLLTPPPEPASGTSVLDSRAPGLPAPQLLSRRPAPGAGPTGIEGAVMPPEPAPGPSVFESGGQPQPPLLSRSPFPSVGRGSAPTLGGVPNEAPVTPLPASAGPPPATNPNMPRAGGEVRVPSASERLAIQARGASMSARSQDLPPGFDIHNPSPEHLAALAARQPPAPVEPMPDFSVEAMKPGERWQAIQGAPAPQGPANPWQPFAERSGLNPPSARNLRNGRAGQPFQRRSK